MNPANWIAVACAEHVARGVAGGFMQVCHGKSGPLARIRPGDRIAYYAPTRTMGGKDRLQSFVATGIVQPGTPYQVTMAPNFHPFRRDVHYTHTGTLPVHTLLTHPTFALTTPGWGGKLRFGLLKIDAASMDMIEEGLEETRIEAP